MSYLSQSNRNGPLCQLVVMAFVLGSAACDNQHLAVEALADPSAETDKRPNILLIVADDMGYSDLGSFGSEIATPNLDRLANAGLKLTNFHASPMCSTTRAMLYTGTDHHYVGYGNMPLFMRDEDKDQPGYEGYLTDRVPTIASRLRDAGYHTSIAGKWHQGKKAEQSPANRGFDRSFVLVDAGANHFNNQDFRAGMGVAPYRRDGELVSPPRRFYSSALFTDEAIGYIEEALGNRQPFFSVLSFTAPHAPLQAPHEAVQKLRGRYEKGYAALAQLRINGLQRKGIIGDFDSKALVAEFASLWNNLSPDERQAEARKMEIYAAMIEVMDAHVGRLLSHLKTRELLDNTLVIFLSDNGASGTDNSTRPRWQKWMAETGLSNDLENMGSASSGVFLGPNWARVHSAPFRLYKTFTTEGGIRVPAIAWNPKYVRDGATDASFVSVMDIYPTLLELAGTSRLTDATTVYPDYSTGLSLRTFLQTGQLTEELADRVVGYELNGKQALVQFPWKLVKLASPHGNGDWQLFNLEQDPSELNDLESRDPDRVERLMAEWQRYVKTHGVIEQ